MFSKLNHPLFGTILFLLAPLVLFSCSEDKEYITLLSTETDPKSVEIISIVISEFEAEYPEIEVKAEFLGFEALYPKIVSGIASNNPPDVIGIQSNETVALAVRNQLEPVTDIINSLGADDWIQSSLVKYKGEDWYVPYAVAVLSLYTRTDLLEKYDMTVPETWPEFLEFCKKLTLDTDNDGVIDIYGTAIPLGNGQATVNFFLTQLYSNDGSIFDADNNLIIDKKPNSDKVKETILFLKELSKYAPPGCLNYEWKDLTNAYYSHNVATTYYAARVLTLVTQFAPDLDSLTEAAIYPYSKHAAPALFGDGWAITKGTKHINLAKELIKRLVTGKHYIEFLHTVPMHLTPPRKSLVNSPEYLDNDLIKRHQTTLKVIEEVLPKTRSFITEHGHLNPYAGEIMKSQIIEEMIQNVIANDMDLDKAISVAAGKIRELMRNLDSIR
ncbi:MAG: extracellular solute-binding protein [candidate division Zixibacteria bacterium]|nr:extracellular solute-binding protein [candidate division Zixibacteria bacterium]